MSSKRTEISPEHEVPESEAELIDRSRRGDGEAFGRLVERCQDRIYSLAFRLTGQHHWALDLSQEALTRAFAAISRFRGESGFYTWMYRIVMNLHVNRERSLARRVEKKTFSLNPIQRPDGGTLRIEFADEGADDPSKPLEDRERDQIIQEALLKLDANHRQVILLRDLEGMAYDEIAQILEIPSGTVKSRLHRAREELRHLLTGIV